MDTEISLNTYVETLKGQTSPVDYNLQYDLIMERIQHKPMVYRRTVLSLASALTACAVLVFVFAPFNGVTITGQPDQFMAAVCFDNYQINEALTTGYSDEGTFLD